MRFMRSAVVLTIGVITAFQPAHAQSCSTSTVSDADTRACNSLLETADILLPRTGIGLSGGNPVAGASSTLGMRIGSIPRMTIAARFTGVRLNVQGTGSPKEVKSLATSFNVDGAVGLFTGWSLAPTIGGFGSLDLVASAGKLGLPAELEIRDNPSSWALGARLGVLRESFTAPGVSVTALYRRIGDLEVAAGALGSDTREFSLTDNSALSVRAVVGKRLFVLGANAGIGYDQYSSDVSVSQNTGVVTSTSSFSESDRKTDRVTAFANVSWTMLILNLVAEGGWQQGGDAFTAPLPAGQESRRENRTFYGSLAIRLAL